MKRAPFVCEITLVYLCDGIMARKLPCECTHMHTLTERTLALNTHAPVPQPVVFIPYLPTP